MNIFGASGHGKVIIDLLESINQKIDYVIDDNKVITGIYSYPVIHEIRPDVLEGSTIIAVGDNKTRKRIAKRFSDRFCKPIFDPSAGVSKKAEIGCGTVVIRNAVINADSIIGKHVIINSGAVVEHDCIIEDFVHVSPNATIAGGVTVGEGTHIGIGAMVIPGIKIGKWCTIGAGAVIVEDVPDFATVVGNPGRIIKIENENHEQE